MSSSPQYTPDAHVGHPPRKQRRHGRHRWIAYLVLAVVLVLWQLNPIISGLNTLRHGLMSAESVRVLIGHALTFLYQKSLSALIPFLQHLK